MFKEGIVKYLRFLGNLRNKVFLRFLLSYFFMLLIPTLINLKTYSLSVDTIKKNTTDFHKTQLNQSILMVDDIFKDMRSMATQIANNPRVENLMKQNAPLNGTSYIQFTQIIEEIYNYAIVKDFFKGKNYYLYFKNSDYIVTPDTVYPSDVYYHTFIDKKDTAYDEWLSFIGEKFHSSSTYYNKYYEMGYTATSEEIIFAESIPQIFYKRSSGTFLVELEKKYLEEIFSPLNLSSRQCVYLVDSNNELIMLFGDKEFYSDQQKIIDNLKDAKNLDTVDYNGEKIIVTQAQSLYNGWKYVVLTPESTMFREINRIQAISLMALLIIFVVGAVAALFLTSRNSKPIIKLSKDLGNYLGESFHGDSFAGIDSGIQALMADNKALMQDIEGQKPYMFNTFINNIISGQIINQEEAEATAKYLSIDLSGNSFSSVILRIFDYDTTIIMTEESLKEFGIWKSVVRATIYKYFGNNIITHDKGQNRIAIIFNLTKERLTFEEFSTYSEKAFNQINEELKKTYNTKIHIGIGSHCESILDIWRTLEQAELALRYGENTVISYEEILRKEDAYYYPSEYEQRLINLCKMSDYEQLDKNLDILYEENFVKRSLSFDSAKEIIIELRSTLKKIQCSDEAVTEMIGKISTKTNKTNQNFELIKATYRLICQYNQGEKNNSNRQFINKITDYIGSNYQDPDLGLYKIATNFSLSEGYFSFLFKEQLGVNFTEYLEKIRLDKSIELLKNSKDTIDKIAQNVGYNSAQSYRRAFKKIYGYSPTIIRKE